METITDAEFAEAVEAVNSPTAKRILKLETALRLVMACAGEIEQATDADLEAALVCGDAETELQAHAWLLAREALKPDHHE